MAVARLGQRKAANLAKAQLITAVETTWRTWRAFIREKQDDIQRRQNDATVLDDLTLKPGQSAGPVRAKLSAAIRQELSAVLEARRQEAQRVAEVDARKIGSAPLDPEQVLARVVQRVSDELEGKIHKQGLALVWYDNQLVEFDHRTVARTTRDDDYLLAGGDASRQQRQRRVIVGGVAVMAVVLVLVLVLRPFAASGSTAPAVVPAATIGKQRVPLWDAPVVVVGDQRSPVSGAALGYPLLLCITPEQQKAATPWTTLTIEGTESVRTYRLNADAQALPRDLVVANCAQSPPQLLRSAGLVDAVTSRPLDAGLIRSVAVWGADTDPSAIPADRMHVELVITDPEVGPNTLILADGSRWSPTSSTPDGDTLRLSYLVPAAQGPQEAGWEVSAAGQLPGLLPVQVPAPMGRAALLRDRLQVRDGNATVTTREGQPVVSLRVTVAVTDGASALTLLPGDLVVKRSDGGPVADVVWSPPTMEPGVAETVEIVIPVNGRRPPLDVALAAYRARVGW